MTYPEGRKPIEWSDLKGYPSDALAEAKALRARVAELEDTSAMTEVYRLCIAITHAMERLDASMFTNAEHQQAKDILRAALKQEGET